MPASLKSDYSTTCSSPRDSLTGRLTETEPKMSSHDLRSGRLAGTAVADPLRLPTTGREESVGRQPGLNQAGRRFWNKEQPALLVPGTSPSGTTQSTSPPDKLLCKGG